MEKRRVLLADGRYLIYYIFEDSDLQVPADKAEIENETPRREGDPDE